LIRTSANFMRRFAFSVLLAFASALFALAAEFVPAASPTTGGIAPTGAPGEQHGARSGAAEEVAASTAERRGNAPGQAERDAAPPRGGKAKVLGAAPRPPVRFALAEAGLAGRHAGAGASPEHPPYLPTGPPAASAAATG
jgi:hypothetical protein